MALAIFSIFAPGLARRESSTQAVSAPIHTCPHPCTHARPRHLRRHKHVSTMMQTHGATEQSLRPRNTSHALPPEHMLHPRNTASICCIPATHAAYACVMLPGCRICLRPRNICCIPATPPTPYLHMLHPRNTSHALPWWTRRGGRSSPPRGSRCRRLP